MTNQIKPAPVSHMASQMDHAPVNSKSSNNLVWCSKCKTEYKTGTTHNCTGYGNLHPISSFPPVY